LYWSDWKVVVPKTILFVPAKRMMLYINIFGRFYPTADIVAIACFDHRIALSNGRKPPLDVRFPAFDYRTNQTKCHTAAFDVFCDPNYLFVHLALQGKYERFRKNID